MTDKVQKIREEVEKRYKYWKEKESNSHSIESEIRMSECQHLLLMFDSLQEEPVSEDICNQCEAHNDKDKCDGLVFGHNCPIVTTSEDLEEASEEYTGKVLERTNMLIGNQPVGEEIDAAFKAGVQWQKEQMIAEAIDAHCFGFQGAALFSFRLPADKYLVGSKVKVIVIKED